MQTDESGNNIQNHELHFESVVVLFDLLEQFLSEILRIVN